MKFCSNCGKMMNDEERFCPACGTDSGTVEQSASQPQQNAQPTYTYGAGQQGASQPQQNTQPTYTYGAGQQGASQPQQNTQPMYTYGAGQQGASQPQQNTQPTYTYGAGQSMYAQPSPAASKPSKSNIIRKLPVIGAAAIALVLVLIFLFRSVVGSGSLTANGAVKDYFKAVEDGSGKKIMNATLSNPMIKALCAEGDMTKKELIESLDMDYDKYGFEFQYRKIVIEDKEKVDKADVKEFNKACKDSTGVNPHIRKAYTIEVSYECRYAYGGEWSDWEDDSETFVVYKSNGNWYVMEDSMF